MRQRTLINAIAKGKRLINKDMYGIYDVIEGTAYEYHLTEEEKEDLKTSLIKYAKKNHFMEVTETTNTNKLEKEVDSMKIESINRVAENAMEVTFTEKNMTASILVERIEEDEMYFTLNNATFDGYKFTRKERTHSIIEFAGEVPQSIADKVQNFIDNIFYLNTCPMTKEDEKMYYQIMDSFDQTEVSKEETEEINNTTAANTSKEVTENKEETNDFNMIERKNEDNSVKKPWLTMTGKVYDGKKARAIENFLEEVLVGKDEKYATQKSLEKILSDNNIEAHIDSYHIKQLKIGYEYIYIFDELEIPLTIGIDEYGKIEDVI